MLRCSYVTLRPAISTFFLVGELVGLIVELMPKQVEPLTELAVKNLNPKKSILHTCEKHGSS